MHSKEDLKEKAQIFEALAHPIRYDKIFNNSKLRRSFSKTCQ
jgi:hypothetical protein